MHLIFLSKLVFAILIAGVFSISFAQNKEVREVISEGVGRDVAEAAQNAAQNALTTVVGSFMDSSTVLEKRVQIQDGVKTQTKNIKKDVKEYSQGFIQKFEILSTSNEGLIKVTAKVSVRIDDFKTYIRKLAEVEVAVNEGLFAQIKTEEKQSQNATSLIYDSIITPIVRGEVITLTASAPKPLSQFDEKISKNFADFERKNPQLSIVGFNVDAKIAEEFIQNTRKILDSIAKKKTSGITPNNILIRAEHEFNDDFNKEKDIRLFAFEQTPGGLNVNEMDGTLYIIPAVRNEFLNKDKWIANMVGLHVNPYAPTPTPFPSLQLEFLDANKQILQRERLGSSRLVVAPYDTGFGDHWANPYFSSPWSLVGGRPFSGILIRNSSKFLVFVAVDLQSLKQAKSVSLKLIN